MSAGESGPGVLSPVRNAARTVFTIPPFAVLHLRRRRHMVLSETEVELLSERPPPHRHHPRLQPRDGGVGPIVMRTYEVDVVRPVLDATTLMTDLRTDPNHFNSDLVAGFVIGDRPVRNVGVGDELVVELPGPWNGPCTVEALDDQTMLLATLDGHMEAGHIRFRTEPSADGFTFQIRSWARAGDGGFAALHLVVPIAKTLQTAMWSAMCDRVVAVSGGERDGPIRVTTERLAGSDRSTS